MGRRDLDRLLVDPPRQVASPLRGRMVLRSPQGRRKRPGRPLPDTRGVVAIAWARNRCIFVADQWFIYPLLLEVPVPVPVPSILCSMI